MADPATAAAGAEGAGGEEQAGKAAKAGTGDSQIGTAEFAKAKAGKGVKVADNGDTYTVSGITESGHEWSKEFVSTDGSTHDVGNPDSGYTAKVKAHLSGGLDGDEPGQDSNEDGTYRGKSLDEGKGGRSAMMKDRIIVELVNKGYSHEGAENIARKQTYQHGVDKYGQAQMDEWAGKEKAA